MTEVVEKDDDGSEKVIVPGAKVIRGTVERVTGSGNVIVYPTEHDPALKAGEEALIVTDEPKMKDMDFGLELVKEHVASPYDSDYAILVRSTHKALAQCSLYCGGQKLSAVDSIGTARTELPLSAGGVIYFRVPSSVKLRADTSVDLKDGGMTVVREDLLAMPGSAQV